ncbi:SGS-domain-containing protein [Aulographum hederae CBS 113979]|uniref:SGS-domain-containing protein n=1 Tax=Aulographum hederae CBS 113979 TaxID=1176131 RepID=A0A6G1HDT5_9PEZI|nr:SGS-domain-containing protein [Aulographum hederae CBS 113979]
MDNAKRGDAALEAGKFDEAAKEFTAAIKQSPSSVDYYIKRSTAYQRKSPPDLELALADANHAVRNAQARARREQIADAQQKRMVILYNMGRYADAQFVLQFVKKFNEKLKTNTFWEANIKTKLGKLGDDDAGKKLSLGITETPTADEAEGITSKEKTTRNEPAAPKAIAPTPASKIKHDWFQSPDSVFLNILAKGVPQDKASIDIQPQSISVSFPTADNSVYDFSIDPLFAPADVEKSTSKITPHKIEIVLKKATPGEKWKGLEGTGAAIQSKDTTSSPDPVKAAVLSESKSAAHLYPSSSRSGPKDWDKLASSLTKKRDPNSKDAEDDEGIEGPNDFFQSIYAGATDDQKRAMMKSYTESNGTSLSTEWSSVSKGKVETQPPDGMVAKKWGE